MVVRGQEEDWVAFENLRASSEAMRVVTERGRPYGQSARTRRNSLSERRGSSSASTTSLPAPPSDTASRTSKSRVPAVSRTATPRTVRTARTSSRRRASSVSSAQKAQGYHSSTVPAEVVSKPPVDVVRSRTTSTAETGSSSDSGSDPTAPVRVVTRKTNNVDRSSQRSSVDRASRRGRSRSRTRPVQVPNSSTSAAQKSHRARSSSRARGTSTSTRNRGRSVSRSRQRAASVHRTRSRSQSLTRITSPAQGSYRLPPTSLSRTAQQGIELGSSKERSFNWNAHDLETSRSAQSKSGIMERLFGDQVERNQGRRGGYDFRPRTLLAATVYHNTATNLWITTINTCQKGVAKNPALANKYLKAFSFPTELEARESAIANAPPKMIAFKDSPECFICRGKFAVFRRACHCRNCGVCVCSNCTTTWTSKMIPDTYNLKKEATVKICKSCDSISNLFKAALLSGDYDEAVALYGSGNVNLRTPFCPTNKKGETMHPVHCAVEGGNLDVIRWLIEDHFCPIKLIRAGGTKKMKRGGGIDTLIPTSKGRTVLSIALERLKVDVMRYLVVDCGVSIHDCTDLNLSLRALEASLVALPRSSKRRPCADDSFLSARWDKASFDEMSEPSSLGYDEYETYSIGNKSHRTSKSNKTSKTSRSNRTKGTTTDACIICFERKINCVATPCGHQVCCLECSGNLSACPVCNNRGEFIRIFRP